MRVTQKLKFQLGFAMAMVMLIFTAAVVLAARQVSAQHEMVSEFEARHLQHIVKSDDMALAISQVQQWLTDVGATHEKQSLQEAATAAQRYREHLTWFKADFAAHEPEGVAELESFGKDFDQLWTVGEKMAQAYLSQDAEAGRALMQGQGQEPGFDKRVDALQKATLEFRNGHAADGKTLVHSVKEAASSALRSLGGGLIVAVLVSLSITGVLLKRIHRLLGGEVIQAVAVAQQVSSGDLRKSTPSADIPSGSVLAMLSQMQDALAQVVRRVYEGSANVAAASTQIACGNSDLAARTATQSSSVQQISATMQDLKSTVHHSAGDADQARNLVAHSCQLAQRSGAEVEAAIATISEVDDTSKKMSDIIEVIDGIAFQTNILALNAAVEAARAGELGRGFAVVAQEVRALAGRSSSAAKDIRIMIQRNRSCVDTGMAKVRSAGVTVSEVNGILQTALEKVQDIHSAGTHQAHAIQEVATAIEVLDGVAQGNSALVEETAAAAESLSEHAKELLQTIEVFQLSEA